MNNIVSLKEYQKAQHWAEMQARNDAIASENAKMTDEERRKILEAHYWGGD